MSRRDICHRTQAIVIKFPLTRVIFTNLPLQITVSWLPTAMEPICQARLLLPQPKIFFTEGAQVFLTTICGRPVTDDSGADISKSANSIDTVTKTDALCNHCIGWTKAVNPIHGLVTEPPPPTTHCYGSVWFEERLKGGAKIALRDKLFLKAAAEAAAAGRIHRLRAEELRGKTACAGRSAKQTKELATPKEVKPRSRIIIKSMPPRKTAAPPPPPSSPTHGSLPAPPTVLATKAAPKKKPCRKRSPTARIADKSPCSANAVAIGEDFERTQQRVEALKSLLHVFEPAIFEEDGEPIEFDEYEYVKLQKVDGHLQEERTGAQFSYSIEKGILPL